MHETEVAYDGRPRRVRQSEELAREDSQQPAENCSREDDPDQRRVAGS